VYEVRRELSVHVATRREERTTDWDRNSKEVLLSQGLKLWVSPKKGGGDLVHHT